MSSPRGIISIGFTIGLIEIVIILLFIAVIWFVVWIVRKSGALSGKVCPYCAETIKTEAKACRFCGREV
jgi:uncharacterized membrane protein